MPKSCLSNQLGLQGTDFVGGAPTTSKKLDFVGGTTSVRIDFVGGAPTTYERTDFVGVTLSN